MSIMEQHFIRTGAGLTIVLKQNLNFQIRRTDESWFLMTNHRSRTDLGYFPTAPGEHIGVLVVYLSDKWRIALQQYSLPSAKLEILDTRSKSVMKINKLPHDQTPVN